MKAAISNFIFIFLLSTQGLSASTCEAERSQLEAQVESLSNRIERIQQSLAFETDHLMAYREIALTYGKKIDNARRSREPKELDVLVLKACLSKVLKLRPEVLDKFGSIKMHDSHNFKVSLSDFYDSNEDRSLLFGHNPTLQACLNVLLLEE